MAPSPDEAHVHEHCKVLPGLPIVLDTTGLVEEIEQADHCSRALAGMPMADPMRAAMHRRRRGDGGAAGGR